ncbi:MAG: conjugal transfer protein TraF [Proteobacteria bacterium]|nr:conjugal transfer protein TraF [Pseudomonadota bacterium]
MGCKQGLSRLGAAALAGAFVFASAAASAEEWSFVGARYQAMGGAGVAVVDDDLASYWNPAALGFHDDLQVGVPFGFQAAVEEDILTDVDRIADLIDNADPDQILSDLQGGSLINPDTLRDALEVTARRFPALDNPGAGVIGNVNVGLAGRYRGFGISALGLGHYAADPVSDLNNLAFAPAAAQSGAVIAFLAGAIDRTGQFNNGASQGLADSIATIWTGQGTPLAQDRAEEFVFQAERAGVDTGDSRAQTILTRIASQTSGATAGGDLSQNESGSFVRGGVTAEVAFSYGHTLPLPIDLLKDKISLGGNLKYMHGVTYFEFIQYTDIDKVSDVLDELGESNNVREDDNVGIDLGLLVKPVDFVRVGIVGRNLNGPSFSRKGPGAYKLDPQVRLGAAVNVLPNWVIAADVDLTENETDNLDGFESRLISAGTEFKLPMGPVSLALRAGLYSNIADSADGAVALTGGLGLRVWDIEFDLAGGASPDTTDIDDSDDFPTRANVSVNFRYTKTF